MSSLSPKRAVVGLVATACAILPFMAPAIATATAEPSPVPPPPANRTPEQITFDEFAERFRAPGSPTGSFLQYALVNARFGTCVDANPLTPPPNGQVHLWACNTTPQQALTENQSSSVYYIVANDGSVLDAQIPPEDVDGVPIVRNQIAGTPTNGNQLWTFWDDGRIRNVADGDCLEAAPLTPGDGGRLQLWTCNFADWQQWLVMPVMPAGQ